MAHLVLEYSAGLEDKAEVADICAAAHAAMLDCAIFPVAGIRVRAYRADYAIVADGLAENNFLAMTLNAGAGRDTHVLRDAGDKVFAAVQGVLADLLAQPYFALSLEIRVINPDLSWKDTPIHRRLSKPTSS